MFDTRPRTRLAALTLLAMAATAVLTYAIDYLNFLSPVNAVWMLGIPILAALFGFSETGTRALGFLWMLIACFAAMMLTAALFNLGP